jgi:hypothetical protein
MLYPNCSELVTHLGFKNTEDIIKALKDIEAVTGWEVVVPFKYNCANISFPNVLYNNADNYEILNGVIYSKVNIDKIQVKNDAKGKDSRIGISPEDIDFPDIIKSNLIFKNLIGLEIEWAKYDLCDSYNLIDIQLENKETHAHLDIRMGDGYSAYKELTMRAEQHCVTADFPALARIIRFFKSGWETYDGGSSENFKEWCEENGFEDIAALGGESE